MAHEQNINQVLTALRDQFVTQLPEKMSTIDQQIGCIDLTAPSHAELAVLQRLLLNLVGSSATFGLRSLSEVARQVLNLLDHLSKTEDKDEQRATGKAFSAALKRLGKLARTATNHQALNQIESTGTPHPKINPSPLIYLIENDSEQGQKLIKALEKASYRPRLFYDLPSLTAALRENEPPAAIIMDIIFPGSPPEINSIQKLRRDCHGSIPPVVILSVRQSLDARLAAYRSGAAHYLNKPVSSARLLRLLDEITHRIPSEPYRVLMVDDELLTLEAQASMLRAAGMVVSTLQNPRQTLEQIHILDPDVLVLDFHMPEISGPELAALLREDERYDQLPIVFLSAELDLDWQSQALNLGGDDFLQKPVSSQYLISRVRARAHRAREQRTNRSEMQQLLYEREREHQALNQHAIVSVADRAGKITYVNDLFCEISGYSRTELLGKNHRILKSGHHPDSFYQEIWATISSGKTWFGDICNRRKDGSFYWVESTITPFLDEKGKPYQYVSIRTDISHVKATEQALSASAERLSAIMESTKDGILAVADGGQVLLMNQQFRQMWNLPDHLANEADNEQLLAHALTQLLDPQGFKQKVNSLYKLTEESNDLIELLDGRIFERHSKPLLRDGKSVGRVWSFHDTTERLRAKQAAEAAKERLRRGQLYANIGTWEWNIVTGELFWTERIAPLFGYPAGDLETSYDNFLAAVHPGDRQAVIDAVAACVEHDEPYDIEHRVLWPDGTVRWLLERGAVQRDANGKPLHMIGVVQDIDARKSAEKNLQIFKHVVNSVLDGVLVIDSSGTIQLANPSASTIFGYDQQILLGSNLNMLMPEPVRSQHDAYIQHYHSSGKARILNRQVEVTGLKSDGTEFPLEVAVSEIHIGQTQYFVGLLRDISARKQSEQALIAAREEAERANQAKSSFLSSMSHELRTPMNAILGFAQILEYDDALDADQQDNVNEILKAGNHLLELINEVLDLSKVESGQIELSLEPVEVYPIVEDCLSLIQPLAKKREIRIQHSGLEHAWVLADRTRLKQVMLNLLSNAVKYNREGGHIKLSLFTHEQNRLRILVSDTGNGIPPERLGELFEPFSRLGAEGSEVEGTGIGLTITRRIMEMMGGSVDVQSKVGIGSTFWLELPHETRGESHGLSVQREKRENRNITVDQQHLVLYIEDNPANLKLVASLLGRLSYIQLLTAHLPELGLELARTRKPALILLDINMPGMDGHQLLQILKQDPVLKETPVLAVTANAMPRDIERGNKAGFDDYITKPINVTTFLDSIAHWLGNTDNPEA